jgi:hypothetical protein
MPPPKTKRTVSVKRRRAAAWPSAAARKADRLLWVGDPSAPSETNEPLTAEEYAAVVAQGAERMEKYLSPRTVADCEVASAAVYARTCLPHRFAALQEWTDQIEEWNRVLQFLCRLDLWLAALGAERGLALQVFGGGRDAVDEIRAKPGEMQVVEGAIADLRSAIDRLRTAHIDDPRMYRLHEDRPHAYPLHAYHTGVAKALRPLREALRTIDEGEWEFDPDLPPRRKGRKPGLRFPLRKDDPPRRVRQREVEEVLRDLLLSMTPNRSEPEAQELARKLLQPFWAVLRLL